MNKKLIYCIFWVLITITPGFSSLIAQANFELKYKVSKLKSIPQNDINTIFKDSKGFMWIGTLDGLVRFDGISSKVYRIKQGQNSISSNMIFAIDEDRHGNLWIATFSRGLCKLDPITEVFTIYKQDKPKEQQLISNDILSLLVDDNIIWLGNWFGLTRYTFDSTMSFITTHETIPADTFTTIPDNEGGIKEIFKDRNGNIWLGLNSNFAQLINPRGSLDKVEIRKHPGNVSSFAYADSLLIAAGHNIMSVDKQYPNQLKVTVVSSQTSHIMSSNDGIIWAGSRKGIFAFGLKDATWKTLGHFSTYSTNNTLTSNVISSMAFDNMGQIWIGTKGGGINIISSAKKSFRHYTYQPNSNSIANNLIRTIFEDSQQNLWIGTEEGGLNYLSGNDRYNYTNGFQYFDIENFPKEYNRVYAIEEQFTPNSEKQERLLWLGTSFPNFLLAINPVSMKTVAMPVSLDDLGFVFTLELQNDTTLWAGTYGKGLWKIITDEDGLVKKKYRYTPDDVSTSPVSSYFIRNILHDSKGNLWIGTDKGLNLITSGQVKEKYPQFKIYRKGENYGCLSHDYILQVFESMNGKIWMGTMGGGLVGVEKHMDDSLHFRVLTTNDGLPNNTIKAIREDAVGNLWLSTNHGLTKYNPFNGDIINYDTDDGLQDNEFTEIVSYARKNGELVFGGNHGFNVFYPKHISRDTNKPVLFFTEFYILNNLIEPGISFEGKVILNKSLEYTKHITLKHNQNSFSVGFTGLQYNSPQKNRYQYRLEGFDSEWFRATADYRIAKYTNIPSGNYTFLVKGANCDNIWSDKPISLSLTVKHHPLLSTWAYIGYFMLFILITYVIFRTLRTIAHRKKEVLIAGIEKRNAEELAQLKLRFFTNISHEFRTPLTLITIPLEKLLKSKSKLSDTEHKHLGIIKQNTNLMLRLVNQILDFRKFEQGKMKLNLQKANIVEFIRTIYNSFEVLAEQKKIQFTIGTPVNEISLPFDAPKIEKVIYNLLSNAFKYTPEGGKVNISINDLCIENQVCIEVSDTGYGIKEQEQSHIFERYFQVRQKNTRNVQGTGIGLALSKGLIEMHKGNIMLNSTYGKGSVFTVTLPKRHEGFNDSGQYAPNDPFLLNNETSSNKEKQFGANKLSADLQSKNYKILIVEDNTQLRETIADIFADSFVVMQASDGEKGFKACLQHQPHLVISDIMMPNMNGIELLSKIKNNEQVSHTPVILLTAKGSIEDQIEGHLSGADAYIPKPFNEDYLLANVISVLNNRESLRDKYQKEIEINPMLISNSPADVKFMERVLSLIEDNLSEAEFNVDKLADAYGVSRIYLNRKIKALTGETSNQFLRNVRLKHAAELLKNSKLTVSEITWQVGYNDLSTFRKRFKEKFGVTPSEYSTKVG